MVIVLVIFAGFDTFFIDELDVLIFQQYLFIFLGGVAEDIVAFDDQPVRWQLAVATVGHEFFEAQASPLDDVNFFAQLFQQGD